MCFNEPASWISFFGISIVNILSIIYIKDKHYTAIALSFQWVLLMQLFDALAWMNPDCNSKTNKIANRGAFLANITQPIIAFLVLYFNYSDLTTQKEKALSIVVILIYIIWLLNACTKVDIDGGCLKKGDGCSNLYYYWWEKLQPFCLYHISLALVFLLLIRPLKLSLVLIGIIMGTFLVSYLYYSCGAASTWCFFAAFIPIFNMVAYKKLSGK